MEIGRFIVVGENIHCTRIYKVGGTFVKELTPGKFGIAYKCDGTWRYLPVPSQFTQGTDWTAGRVKHCAVAIWQGMYGERAAGAEYLQQMARQQEQASAQYLDINVDEFSTDIAEKVKAMQWTVRTVQKVASIPLSIDSSNTTILRAGLAACDRTKGAPMVNSLSLERLDALAVAREYDAVVIASAAGEKGLPSGRDERLANISAIVNKLEAAGFKKDAIHVDPLVFPISTDSNNGRIFLDTVAAVRQQYGPEIHVVAGLSNVSFGMPNRKLINQVFAWLAVEAGADGGIVDPLQINARILQSLDTESEAFDLARALLLGEDEYGINFITACREGRI